MNLAVKNYTKNTTPKLNYDVLIENQPDGTIKATLLGLPDCQGLVWINRFVQVFLQRFKER